MSNSIQPDDPRLTAYALGELDPTEQQEIERLLADSPEARSTVKEIRDLAGLLTSELRQEPAPSLTAMQRAAILDAGAVPAKPDERNGATPEQRISALATRYRSVADFQAQHTPRVKRFAAVAAVAALLIVVAVIVSPPSASRSSLIALNSDNPSDFHFWGDSQHSTSFDADASSLDGLQVKERELHLSKASTSLRSMTDAESLKESGPSAGFGSAGPSAGSNRSRMRFANGRGGDSAAEMKAGNAVADKKSVYDENSAQPAGAVPLNRPESRPEGANLSGFVAKRESGANRGLAGSPAAGESKARMPASGSGGQPGTVPQLLTSPGSDKAPATPAPVSAGGLGGYGRGGGEISQQESVNRSASQDAGGKNLASKKMGGAGSKEMSGESQSVSKPAAAQSAGSESRNKDGEQNDAFKKDNRGGAVLAKRRFPTPENAASELAPETQPSSDPSSGQKGLSLTGRPQKSLVDSQSSSERGREVAERSKSDRPNAGEPVAPFGEATDLSRQSDRYGVSSGNTELSFQYLARGIANNIATQRSEGLVTDAFTLGAQLDDSERAGLGAEAYAPIVENPFLTAYENPLSTFGVDVDTASYANVRRFLTNHQLPPRDAVRIEELVNYFSYDYPQPAAEQPFSVSVDAANCPWNPTNKLVRVGVKAREIARDKRPPSNLVFLVDVSGSMQAENKLPLVKMGLNLLTSQMTETDRVAIVTYSDTAVQRLESTNGANKQAINGVIDSLHAAGSTNGAAGIQLAYRAAIDHFIAGGTNRVILCTDGDFNVGVTSDDELVNLIQERARTKVFFSVFGFGMGNLKDGKLEKLADKGNGQYAYIDGQAEARKNFADELVGTLVTIAKDVKLQVEFNPNQVGSYRLLGYENRVMPAADFNNDKKDAGDVGAGHSVTALYEVLPAGDAPKPELGDALRYRKAVVPQEGALARELLTVKLRYKLPEADVSTLVEYPIVNPVNLAAVADGRAGTARYFVQLHRLEAAPAAENLQRWFVENKQEAPAIEADTANRRLMFRGSAEQISQSQQLLAQLGETGAAASRDFNWAAAVAAFGLILRDSQFRGHANLDMVLELATAAKGEDPTGRRQEFINLVQRTKEIVVGRSEAGFREVLSRLPREKAESLATVDGKYKNLLRIVEAPGDASSYGTARDFGRWEGTSYAGQQNLPQGYWVYVFPNWYIWGDVAK